MAKRPVKGPDYEDNIYVETAYQIFNECYRRAGTTGGARNCHQKLSDAMAEKFDGNSLPESFIRNKFADIKKLRDTRADGVEIWLYNNNLELLFKFAGVSDRKEYNSQFDPNRYIQLLYTKQPFHRLQLIRIPSEGLFFRGIKKWRIETHKGEAIFGDRTLSAKPYTMSGDRHPFWIEVEFSSVDGTTQKVYLSTMPVPVLPITAQHPLFYYFLELTQ